MLKIFWLLKPTTRPRLLDKQFYNLFFIKLTVLKVHSSSTDLRTITMAISATISHSKRKCMRKLLASMLRHNLVIGFRVMGFCITFEACSFMSCFKRLVCMSNAVGLRIGSIDPFENSAPAKTEIELEACKIYK